MIERVLKIVGPNTENEKLKLHDCPAYRITDKGPNVKLRKKRNYRSAVGCLSYLQAMIHTDITMLVQQCTRFCNDPSQEHKEAVKHICRYLLKTKAQGITLRLDKTKGL